MRPFIIYGIVNSQSYSSYVMLDDLQKLLTVYYNIHKMPQFCYDSVVRGYHVYKDVWEASLGELLKCERETGNSFDPFAVCMKKHDDTVGHMPRKISAICSLFLWHGVRIQCEVTGTRQYSRDIPQGGLEIPYQYIFEGR